MLQDAAKAVSALSQVLQDTPKIKDRRRLQRERIAIAKDAVEMFNANKVERKKFQLWWKRAEALKGR